MIFFFFWDRWPKRARNLISNFQVMNMNTEYIDTLHLPQRSRPQLGRWWKWFLSNFGGGYPKIYIWQNSLNSDLKKGDFRYMCVQSCPTFCDPWTAAHQAPLFPEFSMQEYWSGLPFPSPGDLPDPEIYKLYFTNPDLSVSLSFLSVSLFFSSLSPTHTHTHTDT